MNSCLIIGAKGFIGSAIVMEAQSRKYSVTAVDLDNYHEYKNFRYDLIINAAGNSRKFIDQQNPVKGYELSVTSVMNTLQDFHGEFYIQLSSGAIYPHENNPELNRETAVLNPDEMSRYGFHKWIAEQLVRHYAPNHLIVRMGGFVGPGLKKNAVYDLLTGGELYVHPESRFQFMDTRDLAKSVFSLYENGNCKNHLLNLSARGTISVHGIAELAGISLPAKTFQRPQVQAELNVEQAGALLQLPETHETVCKFITEIQTGKIVLK